MTNHPSITFFRIMRILIVFFLSPFYYCLVNAITPVYAASNQTELTVGPTGEYATISDALAAIPINAGAVILRIQDSIEPSERDLVCVVPTIAGLKSVRIEPFAEEPNAIVYIKSIGRFFANGIPLEITSGVEMPDAWIFGGSMALSGELASVADSELTINGKVPYVFGGGYAENGGKSIVRGRATVTVGETGVVYWQLGGGGYASGEDAYASVGDTLVTIAGSADYAFGGGSAHNTGRADVVGISQIRLTKTGRIPVAIFGGGSAASIGSTYETADAKISIDGTARWVFGGDYAYLGGNADLMNTVEISIGENANVEELYAGGFATDPDSEITVRKVIVTDGDRAIGLYLSSVASKGAKATDPKEIVELTSPTPTPEVLPNSDSSGTDVPEKKTDRTAMSLVPLSKSD